LRSTERLRPSDETSAVPQPAILSRSVRPFTANPTGRKGPAGFSIKNGPE